MWIRIVCNGDENGLVVQARASDLDPWSDVFNLVFFTSEGHTGFAGGPVLIDDLTVKYYINSNWTEACVEDFDVTSGCRELEPLHDANGNLTYDGSYVYTYDGWKIRGQECSVEKLMVSPRTSCFVLLFVNVWA